MKKETTHPTTIAIMQRSWFFDTSGIIDAGVVTVVIGAGVVEVVSKSRSKTCPSVLILKS
jgi:hypothetical protein